jgi:magnesium-transporting ATPase (P-type)
MSSEREFSESPGLPLDGHEDTGKAVDKDKTVEGDFPGSLPEVTDDIPVCNGESPDVGYIRRTLAGGVLCSKGILGENGGRNGEIGNPTELAILRAVYYAGVDVEDMRDGAPFVAEVPFSSEYKFMATVHVPVEVNDGASGLSNDYVVHVKGAPDRLVPLCKYQAKAGLVDQGSLEPIDEAYWEDQISILSSHGLRVLALCRGTIAREAVQQDDQLGPEFVNGRGPWLTMVSLCAIMDPPRPECVAAIKEAHGAGVRVAMITGDHKETAIAIGDQLGIIDEDFPSALTGPEMDDMTDDELRQAVMGHNVFARSSPQNKIRIVKALQAEGQVASMTGDGVNDAPALKAADMGVAMGVEGTDVAREAAEMILADDNFATIVSAVREGRVVWDNLRKVLLVNTPINNAQGMSVLFGMILGLEQTLLTNIQVLYCNLICAVTLGFVTAVEPAEEGIMDIPPRRPNKRLIGRYLLLRITIGTITLVAVTVGAVFWSKNIGNYNLEEQRAQGSNSLTFGAISIMLSARFAYNSSLGPQILYGNKFAWYSVYLVSVLQVFITYTPAVNTIIFQMSGMYAAQWVVVVIGMVIVLLVMEAEKALRRVLKAQGKDTDDIEYNPRWDALPEKVDMTLPKETASLRLTSLRE